LRKKQVAEKHHVEPYKNILRKSVNIAYSDSVKSLDAFANRLSREGVSLKFREFKREMRNGIEPSFGVSYGFDKEDKNKIKFQYSDEATRIKKENIKGSRAPDNINQQFKGKSFVPFEAVSENGNTQKLYASRTFHNEVFVVNENVKHPELPARNVGIKGLDVGNRFNFKSLQENIGFSDNEVRAYIDVEGNKNKLDESPAISKLLHSTIRYNEEGINEALDEGAKLEDIKPIDWESLSKNQHELLELSSQNLGKEKSAEKKEEQIEELQRIDRILADFKRDYYEPNQKTIDLAEAYLDKDINKMNSLLT
jgi:hypothetical protein